MLKSDDYVKAHLVELGWRFGQSYAGGHIAGQMIMHVLANRVRLGWGSWLNVLDGMPKFMAESQLPPLVHPSVWEPAFVKLLHAVDGIYDNSTPDLSKGALYWADLGKVERPWFKERILSNIQGMVSNEGHSVEHLEAVPNSHPIVANLNSLTFFR